MPLKKQQEHKVLRKNLRALEYIGMCWENMVHRPSRFWLSTVKCSLLKFIRICVAASLIHRPLSIFPLARENHGYKHCKICKFYHYKHLSVFCLLLLLLLLLLKHFWFVVFCILPQFVHIRHSSNSHNILLLHNLPINISLVQLQSVYIPPW